jgi:hypothetical protein
MLHNILKAFFIAQVSFEKLVSAKPCPWVVVGKSLDAPKDIGGCQYKQMASCQNRFQEMKTNLRGFLRPRLKDILESTIGDSREINELRAEIATLRSELLEFRSSV